MREKRNRPFQDDLPGAVSNRDQRCVTIRLQVNLDMISPVAFQEIMDFEYRAKARDKIVRILNEKTFDDLETIQGKLFLKDKIVSEVNQILDRGLVKDVYFTDFVMN